MEPALIGAQVSTAAPALHRRTAYIGLLAVLVGAGAGAASQVLIRAIWFITGLCFALHPSFAHATPPHTRADNPLGLGIVLVPVLGAIVIGLMARYGSPLVAGHGIPEAMEQVLRNQSRIHPKMTFLKPLAAAISIGTGGPFGAEGPIIATGGALGSLLGQLVSTTPAERKTLLAAGAAAGIAAAFGSPLAAVLLAIELLLFEFRPRSIIPVAMACVVAAAIHAAFEGSRPFFPIGGGPLPVFSIRQALIFTLLGAVMGIAAIGMTRGLNAVEHLADKLPVHWMWRPAVGAVFVGVIGYFSPRTLGSGYFNIDQLLAGELTLKVALVLLVLKTLSWTISLGSGTSGGTLAPVFTIGGTLGAALAIAASSVLPGLGVDLRLAALVGMVAIFAGASRAMLTCVALAAELTHNASATSAAICGCGAACLVAMLLSRASIMSEKMVRQGLRVPGDYEADVLEQILVRDAATANPVVLEAAQSVASVRAWLAQGGVDASHQGYPIVNEQQALVGVLTRRDLMNADASPTQTLRDRLRRPPVVVHDDCTLREAINHMVAHDLGRLPVIRRGTARLIGIITRSDILAAYGRALSKDQQRQRTLKVGNSR